MKAVPLLGWRDHAVGLALCVSYVALLLATSHGLGMSRDESFYVTAGERYGAWIEAVWEDSDRALERGAIDSAWSYNSEHPALTKTLFALSWIAQQHWPGLRAKIGLSPKKLFADDSMAFRFPGMLHAGLLLWLIYVFGARGWGRFAGLFGAAAYALMPQPNYHAHLDCFDVPIALMLTLCTYAYWRSLTSKRWIPLVGITYGLALATKHNAWILPGVLLIHWLWTLAHELRARKRKEPRVVSVVPWWLLSMAALGPVIFVASWPWLWHDGWSRFGEYVAFHTHHINYDIEYFGENLFRPPFPVSYPFVMTFLTTALTTSVLAVAGLGLRARAMLPAALADRIWKNGVVVADRRCSDVLAFGAMLAPLAVIAWPTTPVFGGTKHWYAAYPFLCIFAGIGFQRVLSAFRSVVPSSRRAAQAATAGLAGATLLAPSAVDAVHSDNYGLCYYTFAAGGVPGAADLGMSRQFWGYTTGMLVGWFREHLPRGGSVWICDTTWDSWRMMQRDGLLPANIQAAGDAAQADYAIVQHQLHFNEVDYQIWQVYGRVAPVYVLSYDGVPIISVYENPHRRRR